MSIYPRVTVGEFLLRIEAGKSVKTQERPALASELGILKVSAVTWGTFRPNENKAVLIGYDPGDCPRPTNGDILISRANTRELVGAPVIVEGDHPNLLLSDKILRLVPDETRLDRRYLARALRSAEARKHFERCAGGTSGSMTNITQGDIRSTPLLLPPLPEQRRIADILDKADAIRRKRKEAIALTEQLLRSTFLEMFGDPVTNPKGWPLSTFGEQLELLEYGPRFYNEKYSTAGIPVVRITDLDNLGNLDFSSMPRLELDAQDRQRYSLRTGDIIFARSGATVGKTALIMEGDPEAIAGAYFIRLRLRSTVMPSYARHTLATEHIQGIISSRSRQSAQQNFSGPGIRELPLPVPPIQLQQRFMLLSKSHRTLLRRMHAGAHGADQLFSALVQQTFS